MSSEHMNSVQLNKSEQLSAEAQQALEAAAFRQLVAHLDSRKDVQNIDLMNLAGFCRNCLSKWYAAAASDRGLDINYEDARERVYGMPYEEWKTLYQKPATSAQPSTSQQQEKSE